MTKVLLPPKKNKSQPQPMMKLVLQLVFDKTDCLLTQSCPTPLFRSLLSLNHTCRRFRYWNNLRRWISWLLPTNARELFARHSFATLVDQDSISIATHLAQVIMSQLEWSVHSLRQYNYLKKLEKLSKEPLEFEITFAGFCFFNCFYATDLSLGWMGNPTRIVCFVAPSFAEMALFCYAVMKDQTQLSSISYLIMPQWRHRPMDRIYFTEKGKQMFMNRNMLGALRNIGTTAPIDVGFDCGAVPETAYSFFCQKCDTNGQRSKVTTIERLALFVRGWFPNKLFPETEKERDEEAYSFNIEFE